MEDNKAEYDSNDAPPPEHNSIEKIKNDFLICPECASPLK